MSSSVPEVDERPKRSSKKDAAVVEVFCRYIRRKDGTIVYPKNGKCFHFFIVKP